jgi:RNA polymerase sigma-70 factor (ECF subfamily)
MTAEKSNTKDPSQWLSTYGDILYAYALSRVYRKELAEDLVQETFLSALKSREIFEGRSSEQTWMISILKNKIIDHYRKVGNSREKMILDKNWEISGEESPFQKEGPFKGHWIKDRAPGSHGNSIEDMIDSREFQKTLELCLSLLPEKWAAAFTLKVMEECESDEVCKDLGLSSSNLWVILHRARLKIRECLEKRWLEQ